MKEIIKASQTSNIHRVFLQDSSSTTGAGLAGLTSASAGLIISTIADVEAAATAYTAAGSTIESITTLGTYAAPTATKCRFKEVDATNHKGIYELQFADARYSVANAKKLLVSISGATNLAPRHFEIQLTSVDLQDGVRAGMTALPNAAAAANGGLPTVDANNAVKLQSGTGAGQISLTSGLVTLAPVTHTGAVIPTVTTLTNLPAITAGWLTAAGIAATALNGKGDWNTTAPPTAAAIATAVWQDTTAGDFTVVGSVGKGLFTSGVAPGAAGGIFIAGSNAATTVNITGSLSGSVGSVTGAVGSITAGVTVATNNDKTGYALTAGEEGNIANAVWNQLTANITTANSIGLQLKTNNDVTTSSRSTFAGGAVASVTGSVGSVTGAVGSVTSPVTVGTNNDKTGYSLSAAGVQAIWDALTSALITAGSIGKKLADWVLGSDNKALLSANAQTGVVIPTVSSVTGAVGSVTGNVGGNVVGSVGSVTAGVNATQINGSATAAAQLALSAATIINGAAVAGTLSTTMMTTNLTVAVNDHYKGRIIIWTSGALQNQATDITAYDGATKKLTFTAVTSAPVAADTFIIV